MGSATCLVELNYEFLILNFCSIHYESYRGLVSGEAEDSILWRGHFRFQRYL